MTLGQIFKSKTIVVGLLLTLGSIAETLVPFFPPEYVGIGGVTLGAVMITLRFLTTLPLDDK